MKWLLGYAGLFAAALLFMIACRDGGGDDDF